MQLSRLTYLYGIGTIGGALALAAQWGLKEIAGGGLALLTTQPRLETFYMPMVWGGFWALLYLLPIKMKPMWQALLFFWAPAFTFMALRGGNAGKVQEFFTPDRLLRQDMLLVLLVYFICWGLLTSTLASRGQG